MKIKKETLWIIATSFILAAAGFLLPFWPITVVGILIAAFSGRWIFAIAVGLLLDIAYGAPIGRWHVLYFPFTEAAVLASLARYVSLKYLRSRQVDTL